MSAPGRTSFRVGIDGFNLALPHGTGVATYGLNLSRALDGLGHAVDVLFALNVDTRTSEAEREILLFENLGGGRAKPRNWAPSWLRDATVPPWGRAAIETPIRGRVVRQDMAHRLPQFDRILTSPNLFDHAMRYFKRYRRFLTVTAPNPPAVMHWTYPLPIWLKGSRNIYTIHDLVPLKLPHTTLDNKRLHYQLIQACIAGGDAVCTVSETSRGDILDLFPTARPDRVFNTFQAVQPPAGLNLGRTEDVRLEVQRMLGLSDQSYFLYFGALEPKKNVGRLIEGFLRTDTPTPLVLVGAKGWLADDELRLLGLHGGVGGRIRRLEFLPRPMLMQLIQGARAVLFPSLYEGFGLPALEALTAGAPLLTSATGALAEVVGDAAIKVDPHDTDAIAAGIAALDRDEALRDRLARQGPVRAKLFSMAAYRQRLATMYAAVTAIPAETRPPRRGAGPSRSGEGGKWI